MSIPVTPASRCSPRRWRTRSSSERGTLSVTRRTGWTVLILAGLLLIAACGPYTASPAQVVEGYESALAEGGYAGACHFLTPKTRALLAQKAGAHNCAAAMVRCLPNDAVVPKKDQSQLFYGNVVTSGHGSSTTVRINGNAVANAIGKVTLAPKPGGWVLTSYGDGFTGCQRHTRHHRHSH